MRRFVLSLLVIAGFYGCAWTPGRDAAIAPAPDATLWYRQPAKEWTEALPIGNGRLGAMVFGGVENEKLQLNEDTLWAGGPYDPNHAGAADALPEVRRLIFAGKELEAEKIIDEKMMSTPLKQMPYQTVGDLLLNFPDAAGFSGYRRELNLDAAVAGVSYAAGGTTFERSVFASPVDQVIVVRLRASRRGAINFSAAFQSPQKSSVSVADGDTIVLDGVNAESNGIDGALKFQARAKIIASGGKIETQDGALKVSGADSVTILVAAATSYVNYHDVSGNPAQLAADAIAKASIKSYDELLSDHIAEHQSLFRRVSLDLGRTPAADLPTDERVARSPELNDPSFAALYFQYARYLLISCSRPGSQPANLQGLWNDSLKPPWSSKYTININTEMNYWPAEPTNLGETLEPLTRMVEDLAQTGQKTARVHYGVQRGWVAHHNTDLWRATGPIDKAFYGTWPTGGAWLCKHLWDHYLYTGDPDYLKRIYPVMKGAAEFFLNGGLVQEPTHGWLVTAPSMSPENRHTGGTSITAGPTMDCEIIRDLFTEVISASEILGIDASFRAVCAGARAQLPPIQIGRMGQIQEWLQDIDKEKDGHRHVSHLYGLYPSNQINVRETPDLAKAAMKTLDMRGDESTGWAIAWRLNLWAKLHDGERAYKILKLLFQPSRTYPNMFDAHPPFQIDGNFGGAAGITQMIMQSEARVEKGKIVGDIELLPALPAAFASGAVKGLRAPGGFEIDLAWSAGRLQSATVRSLQGNACTIRCGEASAELKIEPGKEKKLGPELKAI